MSNWLDQARTSLPQLDLVELKSIFPNAEITQCQDEISVEIKENKEWK